MKVIGLDQQIQYHVMVMIAAALIVPSAIMQRAIVTLTAIVLES